MMLGLIVDALIDAEDDCQVFVLGGRRDDDLLDAVLPVRNRFGGIREETGGLDDDVDAFAVSLDRAGLALGEDGDLLAVDDEVFLFGGDIARERTVGRVPLEHVGVGLDIGQIVDRDDFDVVRVASKQGAQGQATDTTETVNSYSDSHDILKAPSLDSLSRRPV